MAHAADPRRLLQIEDMRRLEYISFPDLSADGRFASCVVRRSEAENGTFRPEAVITDLIAGISHTIHAAGQTDSADCTTHLLFSPDGSSAAFLSDRTGHYQIYLCGSDGSDCRQLTDLRHGITDFSWSPDSSCIAFTAPLWPDDPQVFGELTGKALEEFRWKQKHMPKYINDLIYKLDSSFGVVDGSHTQIGIVSPQDPDRIRMITSEAYAHQDPFFSSDCRTLYFTAQPYPHHQALKRELFACTMINCSSSAENSSSGIQEDSPADFFAAELSCTMLTQNSSYEGSPILPHPDGAHLLCSGIRTSSENSDAWIQALYSMKPDGSDYQCLFPEEMICSGIAPLYVGITENGEHRRSCQLSADSRQIYFLSAMNGHSDLYALELSSPHRIRRITEGDFSITDFAVSGSGQLAVLLTTEIMPPELYLLDPKDGTLTRIGHHNKWLSEIRLSVPETLLMQAGPAAGSDEDPASVMTVQGFLMPPADLETDRKYPSFHYIHGSPEAYYAVGFDFECQMMAAAGLAVLYCNPRGSAGYGADFAASHFSVDGTAFQDLMDFTDYVLSQYSWLAPDRIGVGGGSHGGWMTNYIMGHTDRFRAAVDQRTWSNPATSYGTGDMGFYSENRQGAADFQEYLRSRGRKAALRTIDHYKTPCLLLHGQKDYRCTLEQSEQIYSAMKDRNPEIPCRMVVFPDENHEVSRTGRIHHQMQHLSQMIDWVLHYTSETAVSEKEESEHEHS